ncbi:unnamed protein product [Brachionus calyciflorus]|uniref:Uncharacterized protein n=1 Tax=Brachionus calyciflorus TaxID=104777 RepID=A0A814EH65_9BILA|nr:unnamed protein product [Brachionus calyciflorus]
MALRLNELIQEIDQLLRNDIQSLNHTQTLINNLNRNFIQFRNGINVFNDDFTALRNTYQNILTNHHQTMEPINNQIALYKNNISQTKIRIKEIQNSLEKEKLYDDEECIRKIIEIISNKVNAVINNIPALIEDVINRMENSADNDNNLLRTLTCVNQHLNQIITVIDRELPDLPNLIDLDPLRNELAVLRNNFNGFKNNFLADINSKKKKLKGQQIEEMKYFSNLRELSTNHMNKINKEIDDFMNKLKRLLKNIKNRDFSISIVFKEQIQRRHFNQRLFFQLVFGVFLFFVLDCLLICI